MFTDEEKAIFRYHTGTAEKYVDPIVIRRALIVAAGGDLDGLWRAAAEPEGGKASDPVEVLARQTAQEKFAQVVRTTFGLAPFNEQDGSGCTESMVLKVWEMWADFLEGNAERAAN